MSLGIDEGFCNSLRDSKIIDLLASTGMRVSELVGLNQNDIDFDNRECVFGKGSKERMVYFDENENHLKTILIADRTIIPIICNFKQSI